ncbi:MAG: hypothetical protein KatS3mg107_1211 [Gemmataceae bacterium]|nr:MAG: hypothetical protein KatS3mg107_1211 [Gemmataceae bacterium]
MSILSAHQQRQRGRLLAVLSRRRRNFSCLLRRFAPLSGMSRPDIHQQGLGSKRRQAGEVLPECHALSTCQ